MKHKTEIAKANKAASLSEFFVDSDLLESCSEDVQALYKMDIKRIEEGYKLEVASALKDELKQRRITQKQLADFLQMSFQQVNRYLNGDTSIPAERLFAIMSQYKININ